MQLSRVSSRLWLVSNVQQRLFSATKKANLKTADSLEEARPSFQQSQEQFENSLSKVDLKKLNTLKAEYEVFRTVDVNMPDRVSPKQWARLMQMPERKERVRYLWYIYRIEFQDNKRDEHKEERASAHKARYEELLASRARIQQLSDDERRAIVKYKLWDNNIFPRPKADAALRFHWHRCALAMQHGPHIVFDMSFMPLLTLRDRALTLQQLTYCYTYNKHHKMPAALHLTGVDLTHQWYTEDFPTYLNRGTDKRNTALNVTDRSYLDLFPRERLVYLSPNARQMVEEYDSDKVYIIGAMVDRVSQLSGATLAKAKQEGIVTKKLPLDLFVKWEVGKKALPLNQVLGMLLDAHHTGSFRYAVEKHVPKNRLVVKQAPFVGRQKRIQRIEKLDNMLSLFT